MPGSGASSFGDVLRGRGGLPTGHEGGNIFPHQSIEACVTINGDLPGTLEQFVVNQRVMLAMLHPLLWSTYTYVLRITRLFHGRAAREGYPRSWGEAAVARRSWRSIRFA